MVCHMARRNKRSSLPAGGALSYKHSGRIRIGYGYFAEKKESQQTNLYGDRRKTNLFENGEEVL